MIADCKFVINDCEWESIIAYYELTTTDDSKQPSMIAMKLRNARTQFMTITVMDNQEKTRSAHMDAEEQKTKKHEITFQFLLKSASDRLLVWNLGTTEDRIIVALVSITNSAQTTS